MNVSVDTFNMDKPWKHYVKWKETSHKDHIFYDSIYMKCTDYEYLGKQKVGRREGEGGNVEWLQHVWSFF